jgi:protein gp37
MGETTAISWTDHTFNPWWGCERVSPGCQNCYAEAFAKRTGNAVWGKNADRRRFGDKYWNEPVKWNRQAEAAGVQRLVFCASMADVFEARADHAEDRARLWALIEATPHLTWQLLTKRPENVVGLVPARWMQQGSGFPGDDIYDLWPHNVWIGTTVEDQQRANERLPKLLALPAPVRFLSCEPLLGPVDLSPWLNIGFNAPEWVIVGGESGPKHRPLNLDHARGLRDQCAAACVPLLFKQVGGRTPTQGGDLLDGRTHKAFPSVHSRGPNP